MKKRLAKWFGVPADNNPYVPVVWLNERMPTMIAIDMINSWRYVFSIIIYRLRYMIGKEYYK